jgi:signal transduction histidine kinase
MPVQVKDEIVGVMQALHHKPDWFDENDLRLAGPITSSVAIAVENARLFNEVQEFSHDLEQKVVARTRELAEEKEKTDAILSSIADGLLVLDGQNRILTANEVAEKMLDFCLTEVTGQPISPARLRNPLWRSIAELAGGQEPSTIALVDLPTSPTEPFRSIQAHAAKVRNEAGQVIGTVVTLRDLTALKEVERMKARFMSGVTHELKTPLSLIQLHTGNLLKYFDRLPAQKRAELLRSIQKQTEHLAQLIEDILALSRLDIGLTDAMRQMVDLGELIEQVSRDLRPLAEAKQIHLTWRRPAETIIIAANPDQVGQVIRNLIDNAIKYTPAGGSVQLQAGLAIGDDGQTGAKFQVSDTGPGISPDQQTQIFERFYRVDPAHTIPGTGLGLAIVKEVINAYGGTVELESTPGQGSTFSVTLPALPAASSTGG